MTNEAPNLRCTHRLTNAVFYLNPYTGLFEPKAVGRCDDILSPVGSPFTKEAHYEAERATNPITLVDMDLLAELLVANYEQLDPETRALVPLVKVYWPVR